ncbi:MAG: TldD/PmbA family protein [Asgard group archaeon]|nr:TldD/PmbA family protein [Asgard group archaeon]
MSEVNKMSETLAIIEPFIEKALKMGADEVEFFAQKYRTKIVNFESNNLKSAVASIVDGIGIRVLKNKALGFASANSLDKIKIEDAMKEAIAIAKVTPPEDNYFFSTKQEISKIPDLYDKNIESFSMDDTISYSKNLLQSATDFDSRVKIDSGWFDSTIMESAIVNSNGVSISENKSIFRWVMAGMAIDGKDIGSFDFNFDSIVKVKDIDVEKTAEDFAKKVLRNLNAQKTESFEGPAFITPDAVVGLFEMLVSSASATRIQAGSSFLQDKLGEKIAVSELSLLDDGTLKNQTASSSFDREGVPHKKHKIVNKGVFTGVLYDTFTANKENLGSTGHATGDYRNIPSISTTNVSIKSGTKSYEELISEIDHGIIINRMSANTDPISGDFSAVLKGAQLIKNGEIKDTLREITAVGNIFTNLNTITGISKEQVPLRSSQSWLVPYIVMDKIKFVC